MPVFMFRLDRTVRPTSSECKRQATSDHPRAGGHLRNVRPQGTVHAGQNSKTENECRKVFRESRHRIQPLFCLISASAYLKVGVTPALIFSL